MVEDFVELTDMTEYYTLAGIHQSLCLSQKIQVQKHEVRRDFVFYLELELINGR